MSEPPSQIVLHTRIRRFRVGLRFIRQLWMHHYVQPIDHDAVAEHVREEGHFNPRYAFMVTMSCAIAMLGLLLSSPAVVIGAMLISPLMGPIISLGFSLCLLDLEQLKKSLLGLAGGMIIALTISFLIVSLSPLTDSTPEILARTRPNLFDLLVAMFSGMAGGYAVIKRKGETIVGVAIATALMPPLAVIGFGLATGNMIITKGAFMLFMTNLLAIALTVTMMAKFYGFGSEHSGKHTVWQIFLILVVFSILSLPLGVALRDIAYQTYVTKTARNVLRDYFDNAKSRISLFNISFSKENGTIIDSVILTSRYQTKAQQNLQKLLIEKTGGPVVLTLDQVVVAHEILEEAPNTDTVENRLAPIAPIAPVSSTRTEEVIADLKQAVFFQTDFIKADADTKIITIYVQANNELSLSRLHQFEKAIQEKYTGWAITVIPPFQALPAIRFLPELASLDAVEKERLDDIIWALRRWKLHQVKIVLPTLDPKDMRQGDDESVAFLRAQSIINRLALQDIQADATAELLRLSPEQEGVFNPDLVEIRPLPARQAQSVPSADSVIPPAPNPIAIP